MCGACRQSGEGGCGAASEQHSSGSPRAGAGTTGGRFLLFEQTDLGEERTGREAEIPCLFSISVGTGKRGEWLLLSQLLL